MNLPPAYADGGVRSAIWIQQVRVGAYVLPGQQWLCQAEEGASDAPEGKEGTHPGPLPRGPVHFRVA